jgi:hypothetical protein
MLDRILDETENLERLSGGQWLSAPGVQRESLVTR